jgi:outer membrane protein OmpA-like peptidoglycan-associated protein
MKKSIGMLLFVALFWICPPVGAQDGFFSKQDIIESLGDGDRSGKRMLTRSYGSGERATRPKQVDLEIFFKINSAELADDKSQQQLANLGLALASSELALLRVEIQGHTCDLGEEQSNLVLSQKRADKIKQLLVDLYHVHPKRLTAIGYGEPKNPKPKPTEEERRKNRRVIVKRIN